ncbi:SUMF1/EgtB/PvdO family nonheme iron enzyme [Mucilaginibacter sp. RS28]|uniref:SUMF1/EgtB/PvdO family nonheme iron enzyme n=1 Tax=Mucilaginibacter straminoryzae TaxID=2932774 RepID=A0A9X2BDV7_9SPHI|nr:SUMF1/EgtB/PvdO family nonheme iron enzyme [Mucilaginibacter straminoryzae]MCJ8210753.1 SUMF1/EgtB/PvdO family nonheme iron enzyme [Mucilaginibacter straminoryzae]
MTLNCTRFALVLLCLGVVLSSCSKRQQSPKTGMNYNDKYNGGFQVFKKTHPAPGPGLVPIEGGTFVLGGSADQDVNYEYNNMRRRVTVPSFYMDDTEVANVDWLEYLHWLNINYPDDKRLYYEALPDTLVWRSPLSYNEPYVSNYFRHPAYQDYPVVGVTWDQAQDYCVWRTDRMNENLLRNANILATWKDAAGAGKGGNGKGGATTASAPNGGKEPFNTEIYLNGQYRGEGIDGKKMIPDLNPNAKPAANAKGKNGRPTRPAGLEDGILKPGYRLPSEAEWEYAALGLIGNTEFENISDGKIYPWNGMGVRSPKKRTRGLILANFKRGDGDNMGVGGFLNDKADITAPVRSYQPNDFGLYNMAGNVNEWTADTYRQSSFEDVDDFNPFRGNQFKDKRLEDPAKGLLAKDKYGRPIKDPAKTGRKQKWDELTAQQQLAVGTNARTGATNETLPAGITAAPAQTQPATATTGATPATTTAAAPTGDIRDQYKKPYNPDFRGYADSANTVLYGQTTLVNDHSKVYKGGSWNDRAYWLNPATRRYMDEDQSSAEVGFRCAMTMVGATEINPSGRPHFVQKKPKPFKARGR